MRRRTRGGRDLTPDALVQLFDRLSVASAGASPEVHAREIRVGLAEYGHDAVDAIRARRRLRRAAGVPTHDRPDERPNR